MEGVTFYLWLAEIYWKLSILVNPILNQESHYMWSGGHKKLWFSKKNKKSTNHREKVLEREYQKEYR